MNVSTAGMNLVATIYLDNIRLLNDDTLDSEKVYIAAIEQFTSSAYIYSILAVYIICIAIMCTFFVPYTWNAQTDEDKQKWKKFWNHIEIVCCWPALEPC